MTLKDWQYRERLTLCCYLVLFVAVLFVGLYVSRVAHAATVPGGFTDSLVANGLANPTAMEFAPDGRLFVCE